MNTFLRMLNKYEDIIKFSIEYNSEFLKETLFNEDNLNINPDVSTAIQQLIEIKGFLSKLILFKNSE